LPGFQGDAGGGPGEDGFEEDWSAGGVSCKVEGETRVLHFRTVGEDMDVDLGGGEIAGRDGDVLGGCGETGADVVELMAIIDRAVNLGGLRPIDRAQVLHHAQRVASSGDNDGLAGVAGGGFVAGGGHALDRIDFLAALVEVQLVLQAGHVGGVAVGIELVVELEDHTQGILSMRESLEVPGIFALEIAFLDGLQAQGGDAGNFGHVGGEIENFAASQGQARTCSGRVFFGCQGGGSVGPCFGGGSRPGRRCAGGFRCGRRRRLFGFRSDGCGRLVGAAVQPVVGPTGQGQDGYSSDSRVYPKTHIIFATRNGN